MATEDFSRTATSARRGRALRLPARATTVDPDRTLVIVALVTIGGYMTFQRPFAYLGVPGFPVYIGELLLLAFFVFRPAVSGHRLVGSLVEPGPLGALAWSVLLLIVYGVTLSLRGDLAGFPRRLLMQELVFNLYPLYVFLGLWLGERDPRLLERFLVVMSWVIGIYGVMYILFLNYTVVTIPGTSVLLFRSPLGQAAILLALVAFRIRGYRFWIPFAMNLFVLLGIQNRAAYAGFAVGMLVWALMAKQVGKLIGVVAFGAVLLAAGWVLDLRIEFARGASEYSARNIVAAVIAPFDEEAAAQYSSDARNFAGTTEWRKDWWSGIWNGVHSSPMRTAFGTGYGFELTSDAHLKSSDDELRTPHNWFFYALGYGGWLGVALFVFLLSALGTLLWRAFRTTGIAFGLPFLALSVTIGAFSNYFETPYAAIPVWLIAGMAAAPALRRVSQTGRWLPSTSVPRIR